MKLAQAVFALALLSVGFASHARGQDKDQNQWARYWILCVDSAANAQMRQGIERALAVELAFVSCQTEEDMMVSHAAIGATPSFTREFRASARMQMKALVLSGRRPRQ